MPIVHILGYHTCKTAGGWSFIRAESPFLSDSGRNQWLTQGYYFWTDSDHFAHKWGKDSYENDYAIVECKIEINGEQILDLVGSVKARLFFNERLERYRKKLKEIDASKEPTVEAVILYWRRQASKHGLDLFPFVAIKAQDNPSRHFVETLSFIGGREEMITSIPRQQLCLFERGADLITEKEIVFPEEFREEFRREAHPNE